MPLYCDNLCRIKSASTGAESKQHAVIINKMSRMRIRDDVFQGQRGSTASATFRRIPLIQLKRIACRCRAGRHPGQFSACRQIRICTAKKIGHQPGLSSVSENYVPHWASQHVDCLCRHRHGYGRGTARLPWQGGFLDGLSGAAYIQCRARPARIDPQVSSVKFPLRMGIFHKF